MLENPKINNCTCIFQSQTTLNSSLLFLYNKLAKMFLSEPKSFFCENIPWGKKQAFRFSRSAGEHKVHPFMFIDTHALFTLLQIKCLKVQLAVLINTRHSTDFGQIADLFSYYVIPAISCEWIVQLFSLEKHDCNIEMVSHYLWCEK